jgi:hypothetical protein
MSDTAAIDRMGVDDETRFSANEVEHVVYVRLRWFVEYKDVVVDVETAESDVGRRGCC